MPEDVIVFYHVYDLFDHWRGGCNSTIRAKAIADKWPGGHVEAEGQSGERKVVYRVKVEEDEEETDSRD